MAIEERESGGVAMTCDTPNCHIELLSPGREELAEDIALAGWAMVGKDDKGVALYQCPHCNRGQHPAAAVLRGILGGDEVQVEAPCSVKQGDACYTPQGELLGHYTRDAQQGEQVAVKVQFPEPQKPPSAVELYDDMLEGTDADDDAVGRRSVVAPLDGGPGLEPSGGAPTEAGVAVHAGDGGDADMVAKAFEGAGDGHAVAAATGPNQPPKPRTFAAPHGEQGGGGLVQGAPRPDLKSPRAQQALARAPKAARGNRVDLAALDEAASVFAAFSDDATSWDPDAD